MAAKNIPPAQGRNKRPTRTRTSRQGSKEPPASSLSSTRPNRALTFSSRNLMRSWHLSPPLDLRGTNDFMSPKWQRSLSPETRAYATIPERKSVIVHSRPCPKADIFLPTAAPASGRGTGLQEDQIAFLRLLPSPLPSISEHEALFGLEEATQNRLSCLVEGGHTQLSVGTAGSG